MAFVMRLLALANGDPHDPCWLKSYDPDGEIVGTSHLEDARLFASAQEIMDTWQSVSKQQPKRRDGKPNRPLTAFHIEVIRAPHGP